MNFSKFALILLTEDPIGSVALGHSPEIERVEQSSLLDKTRAAISKGINRPAGWGIRFSLFWSIGMSSSMDLIHIIALAFQEIHVEVI